MTTLFFVFITTIQVISIQKETFDVREKSQDSENLKKKQRYVFLLHLHQKYANVIGLPTELVSKLSVVTGRIEIWKCWFLWREKNQKTQKNLSEQKWEPTTKLNPKLLNCGVYPALNFVTANNVWNILEVRKPLLLQHLWRQFQVRTNDKIYLRASSFPQGVIW